jgi:acetyl-CoA/propionyl-CoA carboxylase biotin carboxyl carrier protein
MTQFDTVLIANRGEIAHRIIKTVRKMGLRSVAIYTAPDKNTPHVLVADEAIYLPELETGGEPYLDINRIIEIAKRTGAKAIHPGYGFLSENSDLAKACFHWTHR